MASVADAAESTVTRTSRVVSCDDLGAPIERTPVQLVTIGSALPPAPMKLKKPMKHKRTLTIVAAVSGVLLLALASFLGGSAYAKIDEEGCVTNNKITIATGGGWRGAGLLKIEEMAKLLAVANRTDLRSALVRVQLNREGEEGNDDGEEEVDVEVTVGDVVDEETLSNGTQVVKLEDDATGQFDFTVVGEKEGDETDMECTDTVRCQKAPTDASDADKPGRQLGWVRRRMCYRYVCGWRRICSRCFYTWVYVRPPAAKRCHRDIRYPCGVKTCRKCTGPSWARRCYNIPCGTKFCTRRTYYAC